MSSSKFDPMFKFISKHIYEINENVPEILKCGNCKNILVNAYYVPCGCSYCSSCVNEMLINGVENCPGKTDYCKDSLMLNNHVDFRVNLEISKFVMKCPEEMCLYECSIINMEEHVRVCEKTSVKCPFANVGCDGKKIARDMLNDHCQSANFNHCKILIEMIDNMRNEIDILKTNDENNQLKIENLMKKLKSKIDKINKTNKETVKQEFDSYKRILEKKFEEIDDQIKKVIKEMDIMKDDHKQECEKISKNLEKKTKEIFPEIQTENHEQIKSINEIISVTNKKSEIMETRLNKLNKIIDFFDYAMIEWTIDTLDEKTKTQGTYICSDFFTGMIRQYKLQLEFWTDGKSNDTKGKGWSIVLRVWSDGNDQFLSWPFTANVTIKMISKTNPNVNKSITKYCKIDKTTHYGWSDSFDYLCCDLTKKGKMLNNCFIIECFINFK